MHDDDGNGASWSEKGPVTGAADVVDAAKECVLRRDEAKIQI